MSDADLIEWVEGLVKFRVENYCASEKEEAGELAELEKLKQRLSVQQKEPPHCPTCVCGADLGEQLGDSGKYQCPTCAGEGSIYKEQVPTAPQKEGGQ